MLIARNRARSEGGHELLIFNLTRRIFIQSCKHSIHLFRLGIKSKPAQRLAELTGAYLSIVVRVHAIQEIDESRAGMRERLDDRTAHVFILVNAAGTILVQVLESSLHFLTSMFPWFSFLDEVAEFFKAKAAILVLVKVLEVARGPRSQAGHLLSTRSMKIRT